MRRMKRMAFLCFTLLLLLFSSLASAALKEGDLVKYLEYVPTGKGMGKVQIWSAKILKFLGDDQISIMLDPGHGSNRQIEITVPQFTLEKEKLSLLLYTHVETGSEHVGKVVRKPKDGDYWVLVSMENGQEESYTLDEIVADNIFEVEVQLK